MTITTEEGEPVPLATVSEDECVIDTMEPSKEPKNNKKKKKKKTSTADGTGSETESDEDITSKPKSTKKKKKKKKKNGTTTDESGDEKSDDDIDNSRALRKHKSIKKKKTSIGTASTDALSDEDLVEKKPKPKQLKKSKANDESNDPDAALGTSTAGAEPISESEPYIEGTQTSGRGGPGRASSFAGRGPGRGGQRLGGADPPGVLRPQSRRFSGSSRTPNQTPMGAHSAHGALGMNRSNHNTYGAPGRPASLPPGGLSTGGRGRGNGRGRGPPSMRRMSNEIKNGSFHGGRGGPQLTRAISNHSSNNNSHGYRAAGKPQSILRSSSHHVPNAASRINPDGSIRNLNRGNSRNMKLTRNDSVDSFDIDNEDIGDEFGNDNGAIVSGVPGVITNLSKSLRSIMDISGHSAGDGGMLSHGPSKDRRQGLTTSLSQFKMSTRSLMSVDMEWGEESKCKSCLRYIRILPPHPNEKPLKKKIRICTWIALVLDILAAIVAITTYGGVTLCCEEPMMNVAGNFPWDKVITVVTYIYILLILLEILPVVREGFPFNLLNPFVGFLITFAVFFDDSIVEAVIMWVIEGTAVACECYIYKLKSISYQEREERLKKVDKDILRLRKIKKKVKTQFESGQQIFMSSNSLGSVSLSLSDDESQDDKSFQDEMDNEADNWTLGGKSTGTDISKVRENKLYRERRVLRETCAEERRNLRYHFIGVCLNVFLVCMTFILIVSIAKNGGLCIVNMTPPNVFKDDQLERCFSCQGIDGICQVCNPDGTSQCYYPYGS